MARRQSACDFSMFVRRAAGSSVGDRKYTAIGVMVAHWVMKRRSKKFETSDVPIKRGMSLPPSVIRTWVVEFLSSWEAGHHESHSRLADELLHHCPQLHERVLRYWQGW